MTDTSKLNEAIVESGIAITTIARELGVSREGFYKKMNNESEFKASEIMLMQDILRISPKKRDEIFFSNKVEL